MFPFDNVIVQLDLSGAQLREVLGRQALREPRAGISGVHVFASCDEDKLGVTVLRPDGTEIGDHDMLVVTTNDFLATGGDDIFTTVIPKDGFRLDDDLPLTRDAIVDWFRQRGGSLSDDSFSDAENPKWNIPEPLSPACSL
jgi:2',3'-cyclic-nucleotide 2'-phosphodiesterase/3'-nucleotidase